MGLRRAGFTLLEIVVATAIVAILGAAIFVTMSGSQANTRVRDSYAILSDLNGKLHLYDSLTGSTLIGVRNASIGRYPQMLSHLVIPIVAAVSGSGACLDCHTSCGLNQTSTAGITYGYNSTVHKPAWDAKGPFDSRNVIVSRGFPIPIGLLRDSLVRTPAQTATGATATEAGVLQIQVDSVLDEDAMELKRIVDGQTTNATVGTIRWTGTADAGGRRVIFWTMRVRGC